MNVLPLKNMCLIGTVITLLASIANGQNQPAAKESEAAKVISGRISTGDNQPLTNARIMLGRVMANSPAQTVRVDGDGAFQSRPLEPGLYFVSAYAPGLIRDASGPTTGPYFRPGDTVDFRMIKGGVITGSVKNLNGDGLVAIPVRAIRIRTQNGDPIPVVSSLREMMTDDRGM